MNTETNYLGFTLPHPFIAGASPLSQDLDSVRRLEDAGIAAITMNSLFEEQIRHHEAGYEHHVLEHMDAYSEAASFFPKSLEFPAGPEMYLERIADLKAHLSIPVIASLNGTNLGTWVDYAEKIEAAGADALELNLYYLPTSFTEDALTVEDRSVDVVGTIRERISIPLAVKISPFFSSLPHFASRLDKAGADALVLFNRYYQPDIDIEALEMVPKLKLSNSSELLLRLRWIALLHGNVGCTIALTGGVHSAQDAIKGIMAGSNCLQLVSSLLINGPKIIPDLRQQMENWMVENEYSSLEQMRGSMSYAHTPNPAAIERANYMKILQSWEG